MTITLERFNAGLKLHPPAAPASPFDKGAPAPLPAPLGAPLSVDTVVPVDFRSARLAAPPAAACEPPTRRLRAVWASDISDAPPEPELVPGVLPGCGSGVLFGASNSGKSAMAIDLACRVASGMDWRGRKVLPGVVVYVAAENAASIKRRVRAWAKHHGTDLPSNLLIVEQPLNLFQGPDTDALLALVSEAAERGPVRLTVVDTLARVALGANENSSQDMGQVIANLDRVRDATGGMYLLVHHSGLAAERARGSTALLAATDVELRCADGAITVTKSRDGENGLRFGFKLLGVELGTNTDGDPYSAVVAVESEAAAPAAKVPQKPKGQKGVALDVLAKAILQHGTDLPSEYDVPPSTRGVSYEKAHQLWRRHSIGDSDTDQPRRDKGEFRRALKGLQADGFVCCVNDMLWLTPRADACLPHAASAAKPPQRGT